MRPSPNLERLNHRKTNRSLTRLAQRSLALQPDNSLSTPRLTLSVGSSISITLHAATQARRLWFLPPWDFLPSNEGHPMDHDSDSSGHTDPRPDHVLSSVATGYSFSNPWFLNFRVRLFSVTVRTTVSGAPSGIFASISSVTVTFAPTSPER